MKNSYRKHAHAVQAFLLGKLFLKILCGILLAFMLYAIVMMMLSPAKAHLNIKGIEGKYAFTDEEIAFLSDDEVFDLMQQRAFLYSEITKAKDDSIGLTIDLHKRSISLEIKGVILYSRPLENFHISRYLNTLDDTVLLYITAVPSNVVVFHSTIIKEPILEKKAPKDTSEVQLDPYQVDTSYREPAFLVMELDNGIELVLKQYDDLGFRDHLRYNFFIFRKRMNKAATIFKAILSFRLPEYSPSISIEMKAKDIRLIYRALPQHPQVSLRIK